MTLRELVIGILRNAKEDISPGRAALTVWYMRGTSYEADPWFKTCKEYLAR